VHALIKNNEPATIEAQAILPMLFVSIDRKYLLLTIFKTSQRADPKSVRRASTVPKSVSRVVLLLMWPYVPRSGTYLDNEGGTSV
jgi:hypothetical protein